MCGRFLLTDQDKIQQRYNTSNSPEQTSLTPEFFPSQKILTITKNSPNKITPMTWGMTLSTTSKIKPFNIRLESIISKPFFSRVLTTHRCLIPVNSFYEFSPDKKKISFSLEDHSLFSLAGIYIAENNTSSCAIITTPPNEQVAPIHPRMPAIIHQKDEEYWLDSKTSTYNLIDLLQPYNKRLFVE